ncbi:MAG: hypothetical protein RMH75_07310 [Archaeoglobaceae archaeon]|nr:hypothetical protein [Archaeoglobaceae archaeon]
MEEIRKNDYDLTARNPNRKNQISYLELEELVEDIAEKEKRILEVLEGLRKILGDGSGQTNEIR